MNEATARLLAKHSRTYSARRISVHAVDPRQDNWIVWCAASDHHVEFDPDTVRQAAYEAANERHPLPLSGTRS